jgi:hypothetical protein
MTMKRLTIALIMLLLVTAVLTACGGMAPETAEEPAAEEAGNSENPVSATGSERSGDEPPAPPVDGSKVEVTRVTTDAVVEMGESFAGEAEADAALASAPMATPAPAAELGERAETSAADTSLTLDQNSRLTAGEVDDNAQWDDYLLFLRDYNGAFVERVDIGERHQVWVQDSQGQPVVGQEVAITANGEPVATLRTHSDGRVYFFPRAYPVQVDEYQVDVMDQSFTIPANGSQREWFVTVDNNGGGETAVNLDILFLIDATGSMSDEINQLKENIRAISAQIDALPSQPDVRFGMVTYRDRGDAYLTNVTDFTPNVDEFAADLAQVYADGGGDYPEDLNQALSDAVHQPEWRVNDTVSLIFLVADAPPHLDYGQQNHYAVEIFQAAQRGIKIYPIASSGLDSQGEYIFRQLAQVTGGRFIFLTYGAEGPGSTGTETEFEVSDYTVLSLDALVVKIVEEELAHLQ